MMQVLDANCRGEKQLRKAKSIGNIGLGKREFVILYWVIRNIILHKETPKQRPNL